MLTRALSAPAAWLPKLGAAVLLASSMVAIAAADRVPLDADALARSRGSNVNNVLKQFSCDAKQGNGVCVKQGDACKTCAVGTYTDVTGGFNGGYDQSKGAGSCGANWLGLCNGPGVCNRVQLTGANCALPPGSPTVQ
jgi:hypothetical protein